MSELRATGPVSGTDRIDAIDTLRGFAVLGILVMNIQAFSMIGAAYLNPNAAGALGGAESWVWQLSHLLFDAKFMSIFSMLFGAGIVLMSERRAKAALSPAAAHYRRMFVLALIGLAHAYLFWHGDILFAYAVCGCLVYLLRRRSPRTLLVLAAASVALPSLLNVFFHVTMPFWPEGQVEQVASQWWLPSAEHVQAEIAAYQGSWLDQMSKRVPTALFMQTSLLLQEVLWRAGGLMLLGMALYKWGVFSGALPRRVYGWLAVLGALIGLPLVIAGMAFCRRHGYEFESAFFLGKQFNYWGSVFVALGWIGLVLFLHGVLARRWTRPLSAVGRTALTNYLAQTVICTTIFYGHGFGLFGQLARPQQLLVVVGVWIVQLAVSTLWVQRMRFGPAEWLWRSATYWRLPPLSVSARRD